MRKCKHVSLCINKTLAQADENFGDASVGG